MKSPSKLSSKGIVLSKENFGEADCYIQFYTRDWGLISTLAKSARKSKRRYVGGLDLFCHDEIFVRGDPRDRPYLTELTVLNAFTGIRDDLEKVLTGGKVVQWVKKLADTSTPMPSVYSLLGQTLSLIEKEPDPARLELLALLFKVKMLTHLGLKPRLDRCGRCSRPAEEGHAFFDLESGGLVCGACFAHSAGRQLSRLSREELRFLDQIERVKLSVFSEVRCPEDRVPPLSRLINQFATYHTHTKLPI